MICVVIKQIVTAEDTEDLAEAAENIYPLRNSARTSATSAVKSPYGNDS